MVYSKAEEIVKKFMRYKEEYYHFNVNFDIVELVKDKEGREFVEESPLGRWVKYALRLLEPDKNELMKIMNPALEQIGFPLVDVKPFELTFSLKGDRVVLEKGTFTAKNQLELMQAGFDYPHLTLFLIWGVNYFLTPKKRIEERVIEYSPVTDEKIRDIVSKDEMDWTVTDFKTFFRIAAKREFTTFEKMAWEKIFEQPLMFTPEREAFVKNTLQKLPLSTIRDAVEKNWDFFDKILRYKRASKARVIAVLADFVKHQDNIQVLAERYLNHKDRKFVIFALSLLWDAYPENEIIRSFLFSITTPNDFIIEDKLFALKVEWDSTPEDPEKDALSKKMEEKKKDPLCVYYDVMRREKKNVLIQKRALENRKDKQQKHRGIGFIL